MHHHTFKKYMLLIFLFLFLSTYMTGCSNTSESSGQSNNEHSENHSESRRETRHEFLYPDASGTTVYQSATASIDASNSSEGYIMGKYIGGADKAKIQVKLPDRTVCTYNLSDGEYDTFPLTGGDGNYQIDILEHVYDSKYAIILSQQIDVTLSDEFKPFLYPNQHVWFTADDEAIQYGIQLSDRSSNDLDFVELVYNDIIENISYDTEAAENITSDYLPDIDRTLDTKKGICFDYASLMSALLRSQGIPTKLVFGYSGTAYHAWISVYTPETGWIDNIIQFDGKNWSLMDPTLAANNDSSSVKKYIGDASHYTVKYYY